MAKVLIVEDEENVLKMAQMMLTRAGYDVVAMSSGLEAIELVKKNAVHAIGLEFDVVLTDYKLLDATGLDILRVVKSLDASTQVLLMTAYAKTSTAVEAMRSGAFDYIEKPFKRDALLALIKSALEKRATLRENLVLHTNKEARAILPNFIAQSASMQEVLDLVVRVAPTRANILIMGESGTGKEVVATAIHRLSQVSDQPFVAVNCGAIPETLIESEFFGYVKGAFTGAVRDRIGYFQAAHGGSLFLDEIGELPLSMQVKLLRAIQERKVQPLGQAREFDVDVRLIAASNRELRQEVAERRFRQDLYFRLNVIQIQLPSLRERVEDIEPLIHHFLKKHKQSLGKSIVGISAEALDKLLHYDYPGNVRELENAMEHAMTLEMSDTIRVEALPRQIRESVGVDAKGADGILPVTEDKLLSSDVESVVSSSPGTPALGHGVELECVVEDLERSLIEQAMARTQGNITEASKLLGISFRSLRYRLKKYGLES